MLKLSRYLLLLALAASLGAVGEASAESRLEVVGPGKVSMLSHRMNIRFGPQTFEVEETIVFVNHSKGPDAEALYRFELPAQAGVVGLSVAAAGGQKSEYAVVGASASTRLVAQSTNQHAPDMGLLRMIGSEGTGPVDRKLYELRVFPVTANRATTVTLRWNGIVHLVAGAHSLRFPSSGNDAKLARTEIVVATKVPMTELYGGHTLLSQGQRKEFRFFAPTTGDVVIQGRVTKTKKRGPNAQVALVPLSATTGVAVVRVSLPNVARRQVPAIDRAVVIVDASESMGSKGMEASSVLVDRLLSELGGATRVEVILYGRRAKSVTGGLGRASRELRSRILSEIRGASRSNGSNLPEALALAKQALESDSESDMRRTLIAIVSDGVLPTTVNSAAAAARLGTAAMTKANLLGVVLVPPNAPLPNVHDGLLGTVVHQGKGRTLAIRYEQARSMKHSVLRELGGPEPLDALDVELSTGDWVGATFDAPLLPGASITKLGFYQGKPPRQVVVKAKRAGLPLSLVASKLPPSQAQLLASIAIANASPFGMPGVASSAEQSHQALRDAAARLGVVTQTSAGVAVLRGDGFAADRLRSAKRWGMQTYRRLAPPAEKTAQGQAFAKFLPRRPRTAIERGATGELDAEMISRRIKAHVIPPVRHCYEKLLRKDRTAAGSLTLYIEIARGEVHHASIPNLPPSLEPMRLCMEDAMYAMPMPRVRQGQGAQSISIARYPLRFQMAKSGRKGSVQRPGLDTDPTIGDPLEGLPE